MNRSGVQLQIPLKGLAIGDGAMDPQQFAHYATLLYSIGFVSHLYAFEPS